MAEKKLLPKGVSELGVVICDLHHDSAVDWSDLSEVSIRNDWKKERKKHEFLLMIALTLISSLFLDSNAGVSSFKVEIEINLSK